MNQFVRQRDLLTTFGNPSVGSWSQQWITHIEPPYPMYSGKIQIRHIPINKTVSEDLNAILNEIWMASGGNRKVIHKWGADSFCGTFVVRPVRGGKRLSNHSFGLAIDLDAAHNPLGKNGRFTADHPVTKIFEKHGWFHGRKWKRRDCMHFEAVTP